MEITGTMLQFELASTSEIAREFGSRFRAHRLAQNLQQSELAARAGVSERALRNFERSGSGSLDLFLRLAMALGLIDSMSNLFELKPKSIKVMEQASLHRQRASRRPSG
jgi:transcriptional regulator with XRE-family HTH domain